MNYRVLGRTGLRVLEIGFGGGGIGAVWGPTTDAEGRRAVQRALDLGVNFFDVAPNYGNGRAEEVLGAALEGRRPSAIVETKVDLPPERVDDAAAFPSRTPSPSTTRSGWPMRSRRCGGRARFGSWCSRPGESAARRSTR